MASVTEKASPQEKVARSEKRKPPWERFFSIIDNFSDRSGKIISYFIYLVMACLLYEIILRYFFNSPTIWAHEISKLCFGAASVLMGAYCLFHNQHIRIDVFYGKFSPRKRAAIDLFTLLFILFFASLMVIYGLPFAWQAFVLGETPIMAFQPLLWPIKACIPIAGLMVLIQGLVQWIRALRIVVKGEGAA